MPTVLCSFQHRHASYTVPFALHILLHLLWSAWRKQKRLSRPSGHKRRRIAVPLSFLTCLAAIGAKPDGITRRAPGRTSHPPTEAPFQPMKGSLCLLGRTLLFRSSRFTSQYIIIAWRLCQVRPDFCPTIPSVNLRLTGFQLIFLVNRSVLCYADTRKRRRNGVRHCGIKGPHRPGPKAGRAVSGTAGRKTRGLPAGSEQVGERGFT